MVGNMQQTIEDHVQRLEKLEEMVADYPPERVARICDVPVADLWQLNQWMARCERQHFHRFTSR